jgi:hypothetical protein
MCVGNQIVNPRISIGCIESATIKLDIVTGRKLARCLTGRNGDLDAIRKHRQVLNVDHRIKAGERCLLLRDPVPAIVIDMDLQSGLPGHKPLVTRLTQNCERRRLRWVVPQSLQHSGGPPA